MNVAIIGAGISGLSCAFQLEKYGIKPTVFEKRSQIGESSSFSGIWMNMFLRNNKDPIKYLLHKYKLKIEPFSVFEESIIISTNKKVVSKGNQGYIFKRGTNKDSLENQIFSQIKTPVIFDSLIDIEDIKNEYDNIVVATSNPIISKKENVWTDTFISQCRVAIVLGNFNINSVTVWFNELYCNKGFSYLVPNSANEAVLIMIINDSSTTDLNYYWSKFLLKENIKYDIVQYSDFEHMCGIVNPLKKDNMYFVGCCAGLTDDLLGMGSINAIESGIFAAESIVKGYDYIKMAKPIIDDISKLHEIRKVLNTFSNSSYDKFVSLLGTPVLKQLLYKMNFVRIRSISPIAKYYNKRKDKS
jgi:digeranylgeranylglycerophospholipid reductase